MIEKQKYCINHPNIPSYTICGNCKDSYCKSCRDSCLNEGIEYYYCNKKECLDKYEIEKYYLKNNNFCEKCSEETTNESAGNIGTINFIGTTFRGKSNECEICHSYITKKYFVIFGIPIIKLGVFRVRIVSQHFSFLAGEDETHFISRKLNIV